MCDCYFIKKFFLHYLIFAHYYIILLSRFDSLTLTSFNYSIFFAISFVFIAF